MLSTISLYSPEQFKSTMVGSFFRCIALAGYLSGQLSRLTTFYLAQSHNSLITNPNHQAYGKLFAIIAVCTLAAGLLILFF